VQDPDDVNPLAWDVAVAVAVGGALGAVGRYGLSVAVAHPTRGFPWSTFVTNVTGCLLIGMLMAYITEPSRFAPRLVRPFLGVGVLGGFTTFSTYTVETQQMLAAGVPLSALSYLLGTLVLALVAVQVGFTSTRALLHLRPRGGG
jgi:CrcB protein